MRKFYLLFVALFAIAFSAQAGVKVIYSQNYSTVTDAASSGWVSPNVPGGLGIGSLDDGTKYFQFSQGQNNDRSAHLLWGQDKLADVNGIYTVTFYFDFVAFGNNHTTSEITVMSDETTCTSKANLNYRANSSNWLFDLTQLAQYDADNKQTGISATGDQPFAVNGDSTKTVSLSSGMFYGVTLTIDPTARTVDYSIADVLGNPVASDTYEVPEGTDMKAAGIYYLAGRYQNVARFTSIDISTEVEGEYANKPTYSLTGINNHQRVYSISYKEGEVLHYKYNGGEEMIADGDLPVDGVVTWTWSNNPNYNPENEDLVTDECTNGQLEIWTISGDAESEHVTIDVDNNIIPLPTATATITNVSAGYGKTYKIEADNSSVELQPQLYIDYTFTPADGGDPVTGVGQPSGVEVPVTGKGVLSMTVKAFGYGPSTTSIENNIEYELKKDFNFAHMTESDFTNAGFSADGNVTGNYSTYGRLYWYDAATYDPKAEDNSAAKVTYTEIPQFTKKTSEWTDGVLVDGITFTATPSVNVHFFQGVGLNLEGRKGDDMSGSWINTLYMTVDGATENDFLVVSGLNNYGSNAKHPVVADKAAYLAEDNAPTTGVYKGTAQIGLYRISDVLARIAVYGVKGGTGIVEVNKDTVAKEDVYYTLGGIKLPAKPTQKGIYIKNGKAVVIK